MGWSISPPKPNIKVATAPKSSRRPAPSNPRQPSKQVRVPVADLMGASNAGRSAAGAAGVASSGANRKKSPEELAANFGYALAFLKSEPELWALYRKALDEEWDERQWDAAIKRTRWYRTTSATARAAQLQKATDPASFKMTVDGAVADIQDMLAQMGGTLPLATIRKIANDSVMGGWNAAQLNNKLAGAVQYVKGTGHFGGDAGDIELQLTQLARAYGQNVSQGALKSWVQNIVRGDMTVQAFRATMLAQAEKQYPGYADKLRGGLTMTDIADPYVRAMASELELSEGSLDFNDSRIRAAVQSSMSMTDFQRQLRDDPRWQKTKKAYDAYSEVARKVMNDWGFSV